MAQLPVRLTDPKASVATQQIHADIYDKLNRLLSSSSDTTAAAAASVTNVTTNITATSISGAGGTAAGPQYAFIPKLAAIPSNNPTTGAPYAQDGLLIEVNSRLLRYSLPTTSWDEAGTATIILTDTHANRVVNYPAASYTDSLFLESDTLLLLKSSGTVWLTVAGTVSDTHANRLSTWPSVQFSPGTYFSETNRTARYWAQNATGTVTVTTGTTVTWVSGNHFINTGTGFTVAQWPAGTPIVINGVTCTVSSVSSSTVLTLSASTTNAAGVTYSVASGRWVYVDGRYTDTFTNKPTDLGENDYNTTTGFQYWDTTHFRLFQWAATGAAPASATPGWTRGQGELPTAAIVILPFAGGQMNTGWTLCNGGALTITQDDATTLLTNTPNMVGAYPKAGTTGTYSLTQVAATVPTITGATSFQPTGITVSGASAASGTADTGGGQAVLTNLTSSGGVVTDPTHAHSISSADSPISLPDDPVAHIVVPFYMKR